MAHKNKAEFGFGGNVAPSEAESTSHDGLHWTVNERYVSQSLNAVLLAISPKSIAELLGLLGLPGSYYSPIPINGVPRKLGRYVGEPDFMLFEYDPGVAVLGEIKIGGRHQYSFEQFTKYMLYGALLRAAGVAEAPVHLLVVPDSNGPQAFCCDFNDWRPTINGRKLTASLDAVPTVRSKGTSRKVLFSDGASWIAYANGFLRNRKYQQANDFDDASVDDLKLETTAPNLVETYVVDWDELCTNLLRVAPSHLDNSIRRLRLLGHGIAFAEKEFRAAVRHDLREETAYGSDSPLRVAERVWATLPRSSSTPEALQDVLVRIAEEEWDKYFEA
jgi:hypothetical protein